jgi:putative glutathione S-transferase
MGMVIDGKWVDDDAKHRNPDGGAFVRPQSTFDGWITADGSSGFVAEPGRYHLFLAPNCPWAHRTQIVRRLKGLENVISVSLSDLPRKRSWAYSKGIGRDLEPVDGVFELHQAYISAVPTYTGRVTVPTLWDKKRWTIVNNESSQIIRMLNAEFDAWGDASVDLYPAELWSDIDQINDRIYRTVNNGVYRCGFAKSQQAYEEAFMQLFETLDFLEGLLGRQRYLCGSV